MTPVLVFAVLFIMVGLFLWVGVSCSEECPETTRLVAWPPPPVYNPVVAFNPRAPRILTHGGVVSEPVPMRLVRYTWPVYGQTYYRPVYAPARRFTWQRDPVRRP